MSEIFTWGTILIRFGIGYIYALTWGNNCDRCGASFIYHKWLYGHDIKSKSLKIVSTFVWGTQIEKSQVSQKFKIKPGDFELVWNEEINTSGYELCQKEISCMDEKIERYIESLHQADR